MAGSVFPCRLQHPVTVEGGLGRRAACQHRLNIFQRSCQGVRICSHDRRTHKRSRGLSQKACPHLLRETADKAIPYCHINGDRRSTDGGAACRAARRIRKTARVRNVGSQCKKLGGI